MNGEYVNFEVVPNGLKIVLTAEGREFLNDYKENEEKNALPMSPNDVFIELLEDIVCNSDYEIVLPEQVGALTDSILICKAPIYKDDDDYYEIVNYENLYYNNDYMLRIEIDDLMNKGYVFFTGTE